MERILIELRNYDRECICSLYKLSNNPQPFVTWISRADSPESTFWGHYFDTIAEAVKDYLSR